MTEILKKADRTLLEMHTGMLLWGLVCQTAGFFLAGEQGKYAAGLWFGIVFAVVSSLHMAHTLDRALPQGSSASKTITMGYLIRYVMVAAVFAVVFLTEALNPIVVFLGYMSLKVAAYLQPFTHKFYNKIFQETDPVPQELPEEKPDGAAAEQ